MAEMTREECGCSLCKLSLWREAHRTPTPPPPPPYDPRVREARCACGRFVVTVGWHESPVFHHEVKDAEGAWVNCESLL